MKYYDLTEKTEELLLKNRLLTICLEGRAASGKTSAAAALAERFDGAVIHTDDFFLPKVLRSPERIALPGGGFHYERFIAEILPHLTLHDAFSYNAFDCRRSSYYEVKIPAKRLIIVEGAYSSHPILGDIYNFSAFITVAPDIQIKRIMERNGNDGLTAYINRWIPAEEKYFKEYDIENKCDITITYPEKEEENDCQK